MPEITPQLLAAFEDELDKQAVDPRGLLRAAGGLARKGGKELGRFGQRQLHSVTGWAPKGVNKVEALRELGAGAAPALKRLEAAQAAVTKGGGKSALRELASAEKHVRAAKDVERLGATSLPGYVKALATKPGQTLSAGVREAWHGSGTGVGGAVGKGLTVGLPAAGVAGEALRESEKGEKSREERVGRAAGGLAFGLTSMPMTGAMLLGTGLTGAAGLAGKGINKLRRRHLGLASAGKQEEDEDRTGPVERYETNAAQGKPPEGFGG